MIKTHRIKVVPYALTKLIEALTNDQNVKGYPIVSLEDGELVVYYNWESNPITLRDYTVDKNNRLVLLEGRQNAAPNNFTEAEKELLEGLGIDTEQVTIPRPLDNAQRTEFPKPPSHPRHDDYPTKPKSKTK